MRAALGAPVPGLFLYRGAARRPARRSDLYPARRPFGRAASDSARRRAAGAVYDAGRRGRARSARLHCARRTPCVRAAPPALFARAILPHAGGNVRALRRSAFSACQELRDCQALHAHARTWQNQAAAVSNARGFVSGCVFASVGRAGLGSAAWTVFCRRGRTRASAARLRAAPCIRVRHDYRDGFCRLLLNCGRLHQLGEKQRYSRRAWARFERFLNPERVSMPDFDIDFCPHGRDRVIQYVRGKYGHDAVSQIVAFGTMAARAAVRDIGRVLDLGYTFTDGIAKLIPFRPGRAITIADALKEEPQLAERCKNEEEVQQLLTLAQRVEGLTRNVGMHAGGVLIAPGKLTDFCPLYAQSGQKNANGEIGTVSQYDKDDVEAIGLVKFDLLGLTTLTILDWVERDIRRSIPERARWSLKETPLDDASAFEVLQQANTIAVFQFEGRGM